MGAQFDRLRYEVFQNLLLSSMNTGLLRPAVATALTVYGIETCIWSVKLSFKSQLQRHLPFTVLKPSSLCLTTSTNTIVATALTVYGIETLRGIIIYLSQLFRVATALTVYGIETINQCRRGMLKSKLQRHLPFTVLKRYNFFLLVQYL